MQAPVAIVNASCSRNEPDVFPQVREAVREALGKLPKRWVFDAGYTVEDLIRQHHLDKIAHISPGRRLPNQPPDTDEEGIDRHGELHCEHCDGIMVRRHYQVEGGYAAWQAECLFKPLPGCEKPVKRSADEDWRKMGPLPVIDPVWQYLEGSQHTLEGVHRWWRKRYIVAGKTTDTTPRRVADQIAELRSQAGLLIEWLRINLRMGWIDAKGGQVQVIEPTLVRWDNILASKIDALYRERDRDGLDMPYGQAAVEHQWGPLRPPPPEDPDKQRLAARARRTRKRDAPAAEEVPPADE